MTEDLSNQFVCVRVDGILDKDGSPCLVQGTKELGPWYNVSDFSDHQIEVWDRRGWIEWLSWDEVETLSLSEVISCQVKVSM
jgi:hypothetical protein